MTNHHSAQHNEASTSSPPTPQPLTHLEPTTTMTTATTDDSYSSGSTGSPSRRPSSSSSQPPPSQQSEARYQDPASSSTTEEEKDGGDDDDSGTLRQAVHTVWTGFTRRIRGSILYGVEQTATTSARYPCVTLVAIALFSMGMLVLGYSTNLQIKTDMETLFTPRNSEMVALGTFHKQFQTHSLVETSTTPAPAPTPAPTTTAPTIATATAHAARSKKRPFSLLVHADGQNILTIEGMERLFDAMDVLEATPGYNDVCPPPLGCTIKGATRLWDDNRTLFQEQIHTQQDLEEAFDIQYYPDGTLVDLGYILAQPQFDAHHIPISGQAYFVEVFLHGDVDSSLNSCTPFECRLLDRFHALAEQWESPPKDKRDDHRNSNITTTTHVPYQLEYYGIFSLADEAMQAIINDLPLLPCVLIIMCLFTCAVFFRCHLVYSRTLLGIGAVITVLLSIVTAYGIMFLCGVPLTIMTNLIVFVVLGVGLDDTFIITGAYFRTSHKEDPVERIKRTIHTIGSSIALTTITTAVAFMLGCTSTINPIRWMCLYALTAVVVDFFYQVTFFIAVLVIDERRIQRNHMDCLACVPIMMTDKGKERKTRMNTQCDGNINRTYSADDDDNDFYDGRDMEQEQLIEEPPEHIADKCMRWFASQLMRPFVKVVVVLAFASFAGTCAWKTTELKQEFQFKELLPKGSYAASYVTAVEHYTNRAIGPEIYFRDVDQSDPDIRDQMVQYVGDLVKDVDALNENPPFCWVRDFQKYVNAANETFQHLSFYEQLDALLSEPAINGGFGPDIYRDKDGKIIASRCRIYVTDLNMDVVGQQIQFLEQVRDVTKQQPINQRGMEWAFFAYDPMFNIFAFYEAAGSQLTVNTVSSVLAVFAIAFILIPHWTASLFVLPIISMLFIEMMGVLRICGYAINVVTYVSLVVSIGLLVDFLMHILLTYYESNLPTREEKVKSTLGTMGASILVGGLSTFLGVVPLLFSTSEIFSTICITFLAMVILGVTHGLILLPVLLSFFGTERVIPGHRKSGLCIKETCVPESIIQRNRLATDMSSTCECQETPQQPLEKVYSSETSV